MLVGLRACQLTIPKLEWWIRAASISRGALGRAGVGAGLRVPRDRWHGPQARGAGVRFEKTLPGPRSTLHGPEPYMSELAR